LTFGVRDRSYLCEPKSTALTRQEGILMCTRIGLRMVVSTSFTLALVLFATLGGHAALARASSTAFPRYDHVFLIVEENHNSNQSIGNPAAPDINALAKDYGLETRYSGVADPSEPNYVAMLGGNTFGISSDDPYFFPGQTVDQPNLMSQLDGAGLS